MELSTIGREIYNGMQIPVCYFEENEFTSNFTLGTRYRFVFIDKGTGIFKIGERREIFIAPVVFCFNESENPILEQGSNLEMKSLFFHPNYINSIFTFENLRDCSEEFRETDVRDRHWLLPFLERENFNGKVSLASLDGKKVSKKISAFNKEISEQKDYFWPCRSRSFLIELLFLIQEVRLCPEPTEGLLMDNISENVGEILLYLYSNYQEKITIEMLTKEFNINRTTLSERFTNEVGEPIMTFLIKLRVTLASIILRDTSIPVSEVMERVGFKDPAYFVKAFRKYIGCPPSEYRQENSWLLR